MKTNSSLLCYIFTLLLFKALKMLQMLRTEMNQEIGQCVIEMLHQFIPHTF